MKRNERERERREKGILLPKRMRGSGRRSRLVMRGESECLVAERGTGEEAL